MRSSSTLLLASLTALALHTAPLRASCPDALAGRMLSGVRDDGTGQTRHYFEWYHYFGEHQLSPSSTLTLDFAIVPFSTGSTYVGLDEIGGRTFFGIEFRDGMVNGAVSYDPMGWNDVKATLNVADQSFTITVNGIASAPLPFASFSTPPYRVASVQALRVHRFNDQGESGGWIDELSITRIGEEGTSTLFSATFDDGPATFDGTGSLRAEAAPATFHRPATCPAKMVSGVTAGEIPTLLSASPAYPMPATTAVTIPYTLGGDRAVRLTVRDAAGELIDMIDLGTMGRGEHLATWSCRTRSGAPLPAGSYFYTIEAAEERVTGRLQIVR